MHCLITSHTVPIIKKIDVTVRSSVCFIPVVYVRMGARRNTRVIVEGIHIALTMNMINTMNNYQRLNITYICTYVRITNVRIQVYNPRREISCQNVEVCSSIVFFIALLTIDLPLPGFLDMLPLSSYIRISSQTGECQLWLHCVLFPGAPLHSYLN